jgi:DNA-binding NarL/FixJ family response regulator
MKLAAKRGGVPSRRSGYLLKTCTTSQLMTAVRDVLRGKMYLSPSLSRENTFDFLRRQRAKLVDEGERLEACVIAKT